MRISIPDLADFLRITLSTAACTINLGQKLESVRLGQSDQPHEAELS
jgi:hypothetical protein